MFFILGGDGKEYGPVSVAKIQEWMTAGRANLQTKARRANDTDWQTLADFAEFNPAAAPAPAAPDALPPVVPEATSPAPATAAATVLSGTPAEIAAVMIARSPGLEVFSCISRSFDLWKANFLPLVGVTALSMLIQMILGFIPLVSLVNTFFLAGIFTGGLYYYYLGKIRGEPREVGDIFAGFSRALVPLGLTTLVFMALMCIIMLPFFAPFFIAVMKFAAANQGAATPEIPELSTTMMALAAIGLIPLLYFSVSWSFAYALVIDQGLGPWTALEVSRRVITKHWFGMFGLMICAAILGALGLVAFFVGIVFTLPLTIGSLLYAYEDLCRPPAP